MQQGPAHASLHRAAEQLSLFCACTRRSNHRTRVPERQALTPVVSLPPRCHRRPRTLPTLASTTTRASSTTRRTCCPSKTRTRIIKARPERSMCLATTKFQILLPDTSASMYLSFCSSEVLALLADSSLEILRHKATALLEAAPAAGACLARLAPRSSAIPSCSCAHFPGPAVAQAFDQQSVTR